MKDKKQNLLLRFFKDFFIKYWAMELFVFCLILVDSGFTLLVPYLNKILIDDVLLQKRFELFYQVLGAMIGVSILQIFLVVLKTASFIKSVKRY